MLKINMTIDEALSAADRYIEICTFLPTSNGWRAVCAVLAEAVRDQRSGEFICGKCGLRQSKPPEEGDSKF